MKIVFIHGMNQQRFDVIKMRTLWLELFQSGLDLNHLNIDVKDLDIDVPFYGDLLSKHHVNNLLDLGTFLPKSLQGLKLPFHFKKKQDLLADVSPHDIKMTDSYSQSSNPKINLNHISKIVGDYTTFAKNHTLKELMVFLNHYPKIHENLVHKYLIETYLYLADPEFMHEVHHRILENLHPNQQHIIVGHSLGSVIAYNLMHKVKNLRIHRFITLGSPLAFKVIQSRLHQPISRPQHLDGDWINFYSPDDFLTAFPLCNEPFLFDPPIQNIPIHTQISNPHKINGYITHSQVIQSIVQALTFKKNLI